MLCAVPSSGGVAGAGTAGAGAADEVGGQAVAGVRDGVEQVARDGAGAGAAQQLLVAGVPDGGGEGREPGGRAPVRVPAHAAVPAARAGRAQRQAAVPLEPSTAVLVAGRSRRPVRRAHGRRLPPERAVPCAC